MKSILLPLGAAAALSLSANAATLINIDSVSASHGGDTYANGVVSLINGSGIDKTASPVDPSQWTFSGTSYGDELMSLYLTGALNTKVAWQSFDFGSAQDLDTMYLFNNNYQNGISGVNQYNLYYATTISVALPTAPNKNTFAVTGLNPQGDYDFTSAGWTKFNTSGNLTATKSAISTLSLSGISARYIGIEILSNHGDAYAGGRVGLDEIAFTAVDPVPEPRAAMLCGIGALLLLLRRRRCA